MFSIGETQNKRDLNLLERTQGYKDDGPGASPLRGTAERPMTVQLGEEKTEGILSMYINILSESQILSSGAQ